MLRLHLSLPYRTRVARTGFSLVELLVSITIFVILATLALSAFRDSKHDKVAAAARQISASIGGARSRASKAVEPRGIRLLRDKQDYLLVSGLQYIGQSELYDGSVFVQINSSGTVQLKLPASQSGEWTRLRDEGLLKPGARIRIPANEFGRWYTISSAGFNPAADKLRIVGLIDNAQWNPAANSGSGAYQLEPRAAADVAEPTFSNTTAIPYLIRLSAHELPETEPINLPQGMVVDLPSSRIPTSWGNFEDLNQNGQLDPGEDLNSNGILDDVTFDINVSPNGTITGALAGSGPLYLYLCQRDDVDRMRSLTGYATGLIPGDFENGPNPPYGPDHPSSERRIVCIIPQTGLVYVCAVDGSDVRDNLTNALGADGWADDPYFFARKGREVR